MLQYNGPEIDQLVKAGGGRDDYLGKSLFWINGSIRPYLHYNQKFQHNFGGSQRPISSTFRGPLPSVGELHPVVVAASLLPAGLPRWSLFSLVIHSKTFLETNERRKKEKMNWEGREGAGQPYLAHPVLVPVASDFPVAPTSLTARTVNLSCALIGVSLSAEVTAACDRQVVTYLNSQESLPIFS